ncbi:DUF4192 domain-containing protein [Glycomyces sp. L485]|uniref:DUF4192 domain-containing protein n=1 Tax=Glycomyces sp. L485 TaxID=2909235 RepID=UPI001F4A3FDA|nr:DUF4192 domain-containing protein [Glycomyces sp. L485]MCH7229904.1 DUF4192 domain-containing protein [Glycomyces sp. L485]
MSQHTAPIKINGPGDLVAVVPHLLGFAPESSLVVLGLNESGLQCTFRVDLPEWTEDADQVRDLVAQLTRNNCGQAVAIVYGPEPIALAVASVTGRRLDAAGIAALDILRVDQGRYWALTCDESCCPPEGRPVPQLPEAVLSIIAAGGVARPDRAAVAALLDPAGADSRTAVAADVNQFREDEAQRDRVAWRRRELEYLNQWWEFPVLPWPAAIARLGLALADVELRDHVLSDIATHPDRARLDLWIWVARHLEDDLVAPAATVAGFAAYRCGNGVLALEAFEVALRADPSYRLAQMLLSALQSGLPPATLATIGESGSERRLSE